MQIKLPFIKLDIFHFIFIYGLLSLISGCGSTKPTEVKTAEIVFNEAMKKFKDEDWLEAGNLFDLIKLQYPASPYADDAQYYEAEIHYKKGEFILAEYSYNSLRRLYPMSEFAKISLFKAGLSFYELSPPYDRDQDYTNKAIEKFQEYQRTYPNDSLYKKASDYIDELRDKLAQKNFSIAELYLKMESYKSAIVYYDLVIDDFPDSKYYETSYFKKIEINIKIKKYNEATALINYYKKKFPNGTNIDMVNYYEKNMPASN